MHPLCRRELTEPVYSYVDFREADHKGRKYGLKIARLNATFTELGDDAASGYRQPAGTYYVAWVMSTRDGITFGAHQPYNYFHTERERDLYIEGRVNKAQKDAIKKNGK